MPSENVEDVFSTKRGFISPDTGNLLRLTPLGDSTRLTDYLNNLLDATIKRYQSVEASIEIRYWVGRCERPREGRSDLVCRASRFVMTSVPSSTKFSQILDPNSKMLPRALKASQSLLDEVNLQFF